MQFFSNDPQPYYFVVKNAADLYWNGAAWVVPANANWTSLANDMPPVIDSGRVYAINLPAGITEGTLIVVVVFQQLALTPAPSDTYVAAASTAAKVSAQLLSSDQILEDDGGVRKLKTYVRGTSDELLPAKTAIQTDGSDLTDPTTQRLAGYRE